jgi:hypothetical protein
MFTLNWFLTIFVDTLSHNLYLNIFDVFLYEGNKVSSYFLFEMANFFIIIYRNSGKPENYRFTVIIEIPVSVQP